jgi:hypothetical protein
MSLLHIQNYTTVFDVGFLIYKVIQEEGLYVYNMHNKLEKHIGKHSAGC